MTTPHTAPKPASTPPAITPIEIVLPIEGMTCASCVNRIERFLRKTPGVAEASVNLATERATVRVDPAAAGREELVAAVRAAGYEVKAETPRAGDAVDAVDLEADIADRPGVARRKPPQVRGRSQ